jgi:hypothetical protein
MSNLIKCDCGLYFQQQFLSKHLYSLRHELYSIKDEGIADNKIKCECGVITDKYNIKRHKESKKHNKILEARKQEII